MSLMVVPGGSWVGSKLMMASDPPASNMACRKEPGPASGGVEEAGMGCQQYSLGTGLFNFLGVGR